MTLVQVLFSNKRLYIHSKNYYYEVIDALLVPRHIAKVICKLKNSDIIKAFK